jgi:hypothetical protein
LKIARGEIQTSIIDGKCISIHPKSHAALPEYERLNHILERVGYPCLIKKDGEQLPHSSTILKHSEA